MKNFDDLKNLWNTQADIEFNTVATDLITKAEVHMKGLKIAQRWTIGILSTLTAVLIWYFLWVGAHRMNELTIGLSVMIGVIVIRIVLEWISVIRFNSIKPDNSMINFSRKMEKFYAWRKIINMIFVPVIYVAYVIGFLVLLPSFKVHLSAGMYAYIIISGCGSLAVITILIIRKIKQEIKMLNMLRKVDLMD